jgi:hypothetical protein
MKQNCAVEVALRLAAKVQLSCAKKQRLIQEKEWLPRPRT